MAEFILVNGIKYRGKYVYLLLLDTGVIKLGVSSDIKCRIKALRNSRKINVCEVYFKGPYKNCFKIEKQIKKMYEPFLVKGEYEFFDIDFSKAKEDLDKICSEEGVEEKIDEKENKLMAQSIVDYFFKR